MIFGIGMDIVEIQRIERSIEKNDRFADRILTQNELNDFKCSRSPSAFLAKRFAAKEALVKAMGTGIGNGYSWHMCEVVHEPSGRPFFEINGSIQAFLSERNLVSFLTISDERHYATATVILEKCN